MKKGKTAFLLQSSLFVLLNAEVRIFQFPAASVCQWPALDAKAEHSSGRSVMLQRLVCHCRTIHTVGVLVHGVAQVCGNSQVVGGCKQFCMARQEQKTVRELLAVAQCKPAVVYWAFPGTVLKKF